MIAGNGPAPSGFDKYPSMACVVDTAVSPRSIAARRSLPRASATGFASNAMKLNFRTVRRMDCARPLRFEHFKDYHLAVGSWSWDWSGAWRKWCVTSLEVERKFQRESSSTYI